MNSRRISNNGSFKSKLILIGGLLALSLLSWLFLPSPIRGLSEKIFGPLLHTETALYGSLKKGADAGSLAAEEELNYLRAENAELHRQLADNAEERIVAGVIGRPTSLPYDVLVIDRGEKDGVVKDAPVFAGSSQVIGFVAQSYPESAVVALVTTPNLTSTVYVYGPNIYTTAIGLGGGVFRIHVPQGVDIKEGDMVVIPSLSGGIYGSITAVDSIPSRPEQYGYVTSETPISSLRYVSVGKRPLSVISFDEAKAVVDTIRKDLLNVPVPEGVLIDAESELASSTAETATSTPPAGAEEEAAAEE